MKILALDPGTTQTGWCILNDGKPEAFGILENQQMMHEIRNSDDCDLMAVEMIASYGMPVGREVFETCVWIGRFVEAWHKSDEVKMIYRKDVKMHLCGTTKAKDGNVRQALIDSYPATGGGTTPQIGTKSKPGPLYGVSTHVWPALAVAVTVQATYQQSKVTQPAPQETLL